MLKNSYEEHGDRRSLGQRVVKEDGTLGDYEYLTYKQLYPLVVQLGRSIRKQFPWLKRQGRSGFYGKNCRDLQLYSLAMQSQDQISVPIYDTLGEEAVRFVIENSGMTVIAVTEEKLPLLSQFLVNPGEIKGIVLLNVPRASTKLTAFQSVISDTIKVIHFEDVGVRSFSPAADLRSLRGARRSFRRRLGSLRRLAGVHSLHERHDGSPEGCDDPPRVDADHLRLLHRLHRTNGRSLPRSSK